MEQEGVGRVPELGMQFESDVAAYTFYNEYATRVGFCIRKQASWKRKRQTELYHVLFTCTKGGVWRKKEDAKYERGSLRCNCPALMRVKLTASRLWEVTELGLNHNHPICPSESSNKNMSSATKRKLQLNSQAGATKSKLLVVEARGFANTPCVEEDSDNYLDGERQAKLQEGDAEAIYKYLCLMQLQDSSFFYLIDFNNDRNLKHVFWADGRSREAYDNFGDVITFDTTCLTNNYDMPFVSFMGVNHHGQSLLLGSGLLADETKASFVWLFNAWVSCMSGKHPNVMITDQCMAIQSAVAEVFPKTRHRLCLWHIMEKIPKRLATLTEYEAISRDLQKAVYESWRDVEFEAAWEKIINNYGLADNEWLNTIYNLREMWVPAYLIGTFFAGMSTNQRCESVDGFFEGYVHSKTRLKDFIDHFELALQNKYEKEAQADFISFYREPVLKTRYCFEKQMSEIYTSGIFKKLQEEVCAIADCFNISQVKVDGPTITYMVKERTTFIDSDKLELKEYEVLFNAVNLEVNCVCHLFDFNGYLCRHSLYVLNHNGVFEIPSQYILHRWRKDFKRVHVMHKRLSDKVARNSNHHYHSLYEQTIKFVEEGTASENKCNVALQLIEESLRKLQSVDDITSDTTQSLVESSNNGVS